MPGPTEEACSKMLSILKGGTNVAEVGSAESRSEPIDMARRDLADALNSKHVSFLLGSGCSSALNADGEELGIPTMAPMAKALHADRRSAGIREEDEVRLRDTLGVDLEADDFAGNLEALMEVLYGWRFVLDRSVRPEFEEALAAVRRIITSIKKFVFDSCLRGQSEDLNETVLRTYERFYRRLAQRDRSLPRPWVFTTNYDLFNELAMDRLGVPYINGFQGSIERRFNPASFRHTLAEQLDIGSRKWSSLDSLVYFAKLHGSLSWGSADGGLFPVVESMPTAASDVDRMLIYPTPAKQNASFAAPYSDIFREFQSRVAREQSALVTVGYSFSDEHVNNIIFQALTIPTFRLVALVHPDANKMVQSLRSLNDPRVWIIGTDQPGATWKAHYFSNFVDELMPATAEDPTDAAIERVLRILTRPEAAADNESATDEQQG